jgi:hypothetical protein
MTIIFDQFKDALEEAKWCADDERVRQFIFLLKDGRYKVTPKYNSLRPKQAVVEVGITPRKYSQRRLGQK